MWDYMRKIPVPVELYKLLSKSKLWDWVVLLRQVEDALYLAQREVITLRQKVSQLEAENQFLIEQLQEEE